MQGGVKTVLVVDDEEAIRRFVSETLIQNGYVVVSAGDANTGLTTAIGLGDALDLVITDVVMPEKDGIEFAEEIEAIFPNLTVLYITGYPPANQDFDDFTLVKPFTATELLERVERLVTRGYAM